MTLELRVPLQLCGLQAFGSNPPLSLWVAENLQIHVQFPETPRGFTVVGFPGECREFHLIAPHLACSDEWSVMS